MMYNCVINSLSSDGLVKVYNRIGDYHVGDCESGILLLKVILEESVLQTHVELLKENALLANLPMLMACLTHNVSKFNSSVFATTKNLKRNVSSAHDLLHQLVPVYLSCPDNKFLDYITLKQNKFEEWTVVNVDYLMKCAKYKYKKLLDKG